MNQELKEYSNVFNGHLNNLIKVIDNILGRYKFSNDTVPVSYTHLTLPTICSV